MGSLKKLKHILTTKKNMKWKIVNWWYRLTSPIRKVVSFFRSVWVFRKWHWGSVTVDRSSITSLIRIEMDRMRRGLRHNKIIEKYEYYSKEIDWAIMLLDLWCEEKDRDLLFDEYIKKWGEGKLRWISLSPDVPGKAVHIDYERVKTKEDEERRKKDYSATEYISRWATMKAKKEFFSFLRDNIENWWD